MSLNKENKSKLKRKNSFVMRILKNNKTEFMGRNERSKEFGVKTSGHFCVMCLKSKHILEKHFTPAFLLIKKKKKIAKPPCSHIQINSEFSARFPLKLNLSLLIQENEIVLEPN